MLVDVGPEQADVDHEIGSALYARRHTIVLSALMDMLRAATDVFFRAFEAALEFTGQSKAGLAYIAVTFVLGVTLEYRKGPGAIKSFVDVATAGLAPVFLAFTFVVAVKCVTIPFELYKASRADVTRLLADKAVLDAALHEKRHSFEISEPAYENAWAVTIAFSRWRDAIGAEPGKLLVTADKEAAGFASRFTGFAVTGSRLGNGNLQNIGVKPEATEDIEKAASVEGTLVIHALPDVKGVLPLIDALGPKVQRVKRSYKMPEAAAPVPSNTLWLHFGKGVRWSSEYWEEQRAARANPGELPER